VSALLSLGDWAWQISDKYVLLSWLIWLGGNEYEHC
jgi:hypothetical protein